MAHVLGVAAVELGDPVGVLVLVVAGDGGGGDGAEARGEGREGRGAERRFERGEPLALLEVDVIFELARERVQVSRERGASCERGDDVSEGLVIALDPEGVGLEHTAAAALGDEGALFGAEVRLEVDHEAAAHVGDEGLGLDGKARTLRGRGIAERAGEDQRVVVIAGEGDEGGVALHDNGRVGRGDGGAGRLRRSGFGCGLGGGRAQARDALAHRDVSGEGEDEEDDRGEEARRER